MRLRYSLREREEEVRGHANEIAGVEDKFPLIQKPFNIREIAEKVEQSCRDQDLAKKVKGYWKLSG